MAKRKDTTVSATDEITQETTPETTEAAQPAADSTQPVLIDGRDVREMSPEEILATLQRRKQEIQAAQKVAKERGISVPKAKKSTAKSDVEQLDRLFNRLGYSAGMRRWADGRMDNSGNRLQAALGDTLTDPERLDELVTALVEGYREAKIQTSFATDVEAIKTKESAKAATVAEIFPAVVADLTDKPWEFLGQLRAE